MPEPTPVPPSPAATAGKTKPRRARQRPPRQSLDPLAQMTRADAAGIDVGAEELVVAVPRDRALQSVRTFGTFTADLHELRAWLQACRIQTVALESTGNLWVPLYQILEEAGLEVFLVNARDVKGIGGRKTDVVDAQWLQQLHTAGLLRKSFRPTKEVTVLRYLMRHRGDLLQEAGRHVQRMQKTLSECNLKLHHVFSDLDGQSAQRILKAILAGERDPRTLARLRDARCRAPLAKVLKALEGEYREEYLFVLGQELARWEATQEAVQALDLKIQQVIAGLAVEETAPPSAPPPPLPRRRGHKNTPAFDLFAEAYRFYGVDLAAVPGISSSLLGVLMSELGTGAQIRAAFRSAKAFSSWLALCPENRISGGKILAAKTRQSANRVATALRLCAQALSHSKSRLGELCRRFKGRLGKAEGITAAAHKLARILFSMLTTRQAYDEAKAFALSPANEARRKRQFIAQAERFGLKFVPSQGSLFGWGAPHGKPRSGGCAAIRLLVSGTSRSTSEHAFGSGRSESLGSALAQVERAAFAEVGFAEGLEIWWPMAWARASQRRLCGDFVELAGCGPS